MIGSCQPPYGLRMDQSQDVGCVAKKGITVEHVLLKIGNQQAMDLHRRQSLHFLTTFVI